VATPELYTVRLIAAYNSFGQVNTCPLGYTIVLRHIDVYAGADGVTNFKFAVGAIKIMHNMFIPLVGPNPLTWDGYCVVQEGEEFGFGTDYFGVDCQCTGYLFHGVSPKLS
jgi:hypothetical protein